MGVPERVGGRRRAAAAWGLLLLCGIMLLAALAACGGGDAATATAPADTAAATNTAGAGNGGGATAAAGDGNGGGAANAGGSGGGSSAGAGGAANAGDGNDGGSANAGGSAGSNAGMGGNAGANNAGGSAGSNAGASGNTGSDSGSAASSGAASSGNGNSGAASSANGDGAATAMPAGTPTATPVPPPPCEGSRGGDLGNCAPEFAGTQEWLNSEPLSLDALRGRVVLIDFWTYTCVNCIRTLPYLQSWHQRYAEDGLVIVGVHTPEFEFEKRLDNVRQATIDEGVAWPVVQDNEFSVWRSYGNRYWPAKYLIDHTGVIRYRHFGEGKYGETEEEIRKLLGESGAAADMSSMPLPSDQARDLGYLSQGGRITPEIIIGYKWATTRGGVGQQETYLQAANAHFRNEEGQEFFFTAPEKLETNLVYFNGFWQINAESAEHGRETSGYADYIALKFNSRSVNAVLTSESGEPYRVRLTLDGEYLTAENKGADVLLGPDGESYLLVDTPKLYKLVENPDYTQGQELRMAADSADFGLYSFTFGVYEDGY